jgi:hypothetical protein
MTSPRHRTAPSTAPSTAEHRTWNAVREDLDELTPLQQHPRPSFDLWGKNNKRKNMARCTFIYLIFPWYHVNVGSITIFHLFLMEKPMVSTCFQHKAPVTFHDGLPNDDFAMCKAFWPARLRTLMSAPGRTKAGSSCAVSRSLIDVLYMCCPVNRKKHVEQM